MSRPLPFSKDLSNIQAELTAASYDGITTLIARRYVVALHQAYIDTATNVAQLATEELQELNIPIGHRQALLASAKVVASGKGSKAGPRITSPLTPGVNDASSAPTPTWVSVRGKAATLQQFVTDMKAVRTKHGFSSKCDNLFLPTKQMPDCFVDEDFPDSFGLRIRIPDLRDEFGTSIRTITNRICFMANRSTGVIVTFDACKEDPMSEFRRDWESGRYGSLSVDEVVSTMLRKVLRVYHNGAEELRTAVDTLDNNEENSIRHSMDDTQIVKRFSTIAKKAAVYKRCAAANRDALMALEGVEWMAPHMRSLCDGLDTVIAISDELTANATGSIDLTIALSDFKGNKNMKIFTYVTILLQPVAVGTGWYGMNWDNMPDLLDPNGYFIFAGVIWGIAFLLLAIVARHEFVHLWRIAKRYLRDDSHESASADDDDPVWKLENVAAKVTTNNGSEPVDESFAGEPSLTG